MTEERNDAPALQFAYLHDTIEFMHPQHGAGHFFTRDCIKEMPPFAHPPQPDALAKGIAAVIEGAAKRCYEAGTAQSHTTPGTADITITSLPPMIEPSS